jgi:hypothetical protein
MHVRLTVMTVCTRCSIRDLGPPRPALVDHKPAHHMLARSVLRWDGRPNTRAVRTLAHGRLCSGAVHTGCALYFFGGNHRGTQDLLRAWGHSCRDRRGASPPRQSVTRPIHAGQCVELACAASHRPAARNGQTAASHRPAARNGQLAASHRPAARNGQAAARPIPEIRGYEYSAIVP